MKSLTAAQRKNLAKKAAAARWKGHEKPVKGKSLLSGYKSNRIS
jgi:hypothetical protein